MHLKNAIFLCLLLLSGIAYTQKQNPLLTHLNQTLDFRSITPEDVIAATASGMDGMRAGLQKLYAVPAHRRNFKNTVLAYDDLNDKLYSVYTAINILYNASPDSALRNTAQKHIEVLSKFYNELSVDENLYRSMKEYAASREAVRLSPSRKKYLKETIENFERNGFILSAEKRSELKQINDKLSELSIAFSKNIATYSDQLLLSETDSKGLPADYLKSRKKEGDKYIITLDGPSYTEFMKYAASDAARKELYIKYNNRAADKNLDVLQQLLIERQKKAKLLGFPSFAAYQTSSRMSKNPAAVWNFESNLLTQIKQKSAEDLKELLEQKKTHLGDTNIHSIEPWETSFYNNLLMVNKYSVDPEKVKEYLSLDNVMDGLFKITQQLFGVRYVENRNASVWHTDVRVFDVQQNGVTIGRFYLDLFPRQNKFTHAACFPIRRGKQYGSRYQLPTAALICNFNAPTEDKPALLTHAQANTFFHEFGHVLHNMLTKAELGGQSGASVKWDFVEAPSQIFENWVWNYQSLQLFAKHYKTGEVLPLELFNKMKAARNVGSGLAASMQINYGILDMTLHDTYDPNGTKTTTDIAKEVYNKILPFRFVDGTAFHAAFGHLTGYAAAYYGYMWSKVYAEDMFSLFEKNGILDPKTGMRYRTTILANGSTKDELQMVREFLGREPNQEAFFRSLGVQKTF
jgi:thimet oligopeptidase